MKALLDSTFLIEAERRRRLPSDVLRDVKALGVTERPAISVISVMELAHGEMRAETPQRAASREDFLTQLLSVLTTVPVSKEIARRAGRLDGALSKAGTKLAIADLLIGATALELGCSVITRNLRHFQQIPGLSVIHHP